MSSVLLDGWYGKRNTGDDAFCLVGALQYGRRMPRSRVAVLADARGVPELPAGVRVITYERRARRVRGLPRAAAMLTVARVGAVVHLGGSRFDRPTTPFMRDQAVLARAGAVRLHAQAVSIGPFAQPSDAAMNAEFFSAFTSVSVRDRASFQRARDLGVDHVVQAFDVAVLLPELTGVPARPADHLPQRRADGYPGGPVVGVALCIQGGPGGEDPRAIERREASVAAALRLLAARLPDVTVRVLCFGADDAPIARRIVAELGSTCRTEVQHYTPRPAVMLRSIAECDFVVAMRLHAAIFSYALRVPFALVDYHEKCADFLHDVQADPTLRYPVTGPSPEQQEHLVEVMTEPARAYRPPGLPLATARALAEDSFALVDRHLPAPPRSRHAGGAQLARRGARSLSTAR